MWCSHCRQDVPSIASPSDIGRICCANCGRAAPRVEDENTQAQAEPANQAEPSGEHEPSGEELVAARTREVAYGREFEGFGPAGAENEIGHWRLEQALQSARGLARIARSLQVEPEPGVLPPAAPAGAVMPTAGYAGAVGPYGYYPPAAGAAYAPSQGDDPNSEKGEGGFVSWAILCLGLMGLVCGGMLLVWSQLGDRPKLWQLGWPIALGGQTLLVIGIIAQVDSLRRRRSAATTQTAIATMGQPPTHYVAAPIAPPGGLTTGAPTTLTLAQLRQRLAAAAAPSEAA